MSRQMVVPATPELSQMFDCGLLLLPVLTPLVRSWHQPRRLRRLVAVVSVVAAWVHVQGSATFKLAVQTVQATVVQALQAVARVVSMM
eukprot:CAMPEP_0119106506 /NCGR_PEP_ID=MMETSP1180-20130426/4498_1 /TAXON_ID=3052 ORGANISM="Chlamydomonas cf sp, Strain CCMP681" /NCGR_SAMPLE_ID=MMETSP1180 /ASSEMBLY_ACC=CAM_ASM_000741 /LENGTH=87 /DNA_ID=CAMNT_0007091863 /DNA_START=1047 /DNA_END=1310 /DNA_ORIENTATION=-